MSLVQKNSLGLIATTTT